MIVWVGQECGGSSVSSFFLHRFSLSLSLSPQKKREVDISRGPVILPAAREEVPRMVQQISLLPSISLILLSSLCFFPSRRAQHAAARATKSSSPLRGGNSVGGKVIRPLATKSFPADSCFIILRPASTYVGPHSVLVLCLFLSISLSVSLSFSISAPPLVSSFHSPSVSTPDRCVIRLGKIAKNGRAHSRRARKGCCCKLGFYYGNSHTHILGTADLNRLRGALRILITPVY